MSAPYSVTVTIPRTRLEELPEELKKVKIDEANGVGRAEYHVVNHQDTPWGLKLSLITGDDIIIHEELISSVMTSKQP